MPARVRPATPEDSLPIAKVHVDSWRTTYAGIVPAEYLANFSYSDRASRRFTALQSPSPATSTFVAETPKGQIVGFASAGPERDGNPTYPGELYAIYLLKEWQGQGIGRSLFAAAATSLLAHNISSMLLWVLEANFPARRFYESLGGRQLTHKPITIGGAELTEISYAWLDITPLATR